jgi:hypothetical protein
VTVTDVAEGEMVAVPEFSVTHPKLSVMWYRRRSCRGEHRRAGISEPVADDHRPDRGAHVQDRPGIGLLAERGVTNQFMGWPDPQSPE